MLIVSLSLSVCLAIPRTSFSPFYSSLFFGFGSPIRGEAERMGEGEGLLVVLNWIPLFLDTPPYAPLLSC
jgi:hypothetical protein